MTSKELAFKIAAYIIRHNGSSYTSIKNRAVELGISLADLEDALVELHKNPMCHRTMAGGDVQYAMKSVVKTPAGTPTHVEWVRDHYPWPGKNGLPAFEMPFPEIDMSWMFLRTLEERQEYKMAAAGRYIKTQPYENY